MYTLLRLLPPKRLVIEQLPALLTAWIIAELFYKFHSFTLECAAFLATWLVLDAVIQTLLRVFRKPSADTGQ
jgi:hypothetical protein